MQKFTLTHRSGTFIRTKGKSVCLSLKRSKKGEKREKEERATEREEPCHMHFKTLKFRKRKHNEFFN